LPGHTPLALSAEFFGDRAKLTQWQAFLRKGKLDANGITLEQVAAVLRDFLLPPTTALITDQPFEMTWARSGPWAAAAAEGQ
jgi:hypothetical protein